MPDLRLGTFVNSMIFFCTALCEHHNVPPPTAESGLYFDKKNKNKIKRIGR